MLNCQARVSLKLQKLVLWEHTQCASISAIKCLSSHTIEARCKWCFLCAKTTRLTKCSSYPQNLCGCAFSPRLQPSQWLNHPRDRLCSFANWHDRPLCVMPDMVLKGSRGSLTLSGKSTQKIMPRLRNTTFRLLRCSMHLFEFGGVRFTPRWTPILRSWHVRSYKIEGYLIINNLKCGASLVAPLNIMQNRKYDMAACLSSLESGLLLCTRSCC